MRAVSFVGCLVFACLFAVTSHVNAAASKQEVERAERLANEGDAGAQVALGILHETGDGVPQNSTEASKWFRRAAEQGDAEGCFRLGWLYARGEGLPQNLAQAAHWYEKAASKGHGTAQLSLGWMYLNGDGIPRDAAKAITWFERAAEYGDVNAQYTLGLILAGKYEGVQKNLAAAAQWFRRAAERGVASAQLRLGALLAYGEGVPANQASAYFWLTVALAQLPDGAFKTEAQGVRAQVMGKLGAGERADLEKRAAAWKPGTPAP